MFTDRDIFFNSKFKRLYGKTVKAFVSLKEKSLLKRLDFLKSGFLASAPFLAAFVGVFLSGFVSVDFVRNGVSLGSATKTPIIVGHYVNSTSLIIMFMAIAFFGNGLASITWVFVSTLAPKHLVGLTGGVFNFIGGLASIIVPIVIGFLAKGGNFAPALVFIAALALSRSTFVYIPCRKSRKN